MSYQLGKELKRLRQIKGVSLRDVEKETQISNAYLSQLERGDAKNPSSQKLARLARYYQLPYEALMHMAGYLDSNEQESDLTSRMTAKASDSTKPTTLSTLQSVLLNANLSEEDEEMVAEYVAFLSSRKKKNK